MALRNTTSKAWLGQDLCLRHLESAKASACQNFQALTMPVVRKGWERQKDPKAAKPDSGYIQTPCSICLYNQSKCLLNGNHRLTNPWNVCQGWGPLDRQLVISWYTVHCILYKDCIPPPKQPAVYLSWGGGYHFLMQFSLLRFCCNLTGRMMATGNVLFSVEEGPASSKRWQPETIQAYLACQPTAQK